MFANDMYTELQHILLSLKSTKINNSYFRTSIAV